MNNFVSFITASTIKSILRKDSQHNISEPQIFRIDQESDYRYEKSPGLKISSKDLDRLGKVSPVIDEISRETTSKAFSIQSKLHKATSTNKVTHRATFHPDL